MERLYSVQRALIKHKKHILWISIFLVFLWMMYLLTKGTIYGVEYTDHVAYGERFHIRAKGLFSSVQYEYRAMGQSHWMAEVPTAPGRYEVKVTTRKTFNRINEKHYSFTIYPKTVDLTILDDEVIFGDLPKYAINLIEGDQVSHIAFSYADPSQPITTINGYNLTIINPRGEDVTQYYNINFEETPIAFKKRAIIVRPKDQVKVYDGFPLVSKEVEKPLNLIEGHRVDDVDIVGSQTDAGENESIITAITIRDEQDNDVTINYQITFEPGQLKVIPRKITVKPRDETKIYDGTALKAQTVEVVEGSLVLASHRISEVEWIGSKVDAGQAKSHIQRLVITADGVDVTHNYEIHYLPGNLVVQPRKIKLVFRDSSKIYDGTNRFVPDFTVAKPMDQDSGLLNGHAIESAALYSTSSDVGVWEAFGHEITIRDENGEDVTKNYDVDYDYGVLEITPRTIHYVFEGDEKYYDGRSLFELRYDQGYVGLLNGHILQVRAYAERPTVGTWAVQTFDIRVFEGNREVSENYDIRIEGRDLPVKINPRPLFIRFDHALKVYDGHNRFSPNYELVSLIDGLLLVEGEKIDYAYLFASGSTVGQWEVSGFDIKIASGNTDVTENYALNIEYGNLTITKRPISIKFNDAEKVYDGTNRIETAAQVIEMDGLVQGHRLGDDICIFINNSNAGEYGVASIYGYELIIVDGQGNPVTDNYDINALYGTYRIKKRPIQVKFNNTTKEYDGTNLFIPNLEDILLTGHLEGHQLAQWHVYSQDSHWGVNKTIVDFSLNIVDEQGQDVTGNYDITAEFGTFAITKRKLVIIIKDSDKVYDGTNLFEPDQVRIDYEDETGLVSGHTLRIWLYATDHNAGLWNVDGYQLIILDGAHDVTQNYELVNIVYHTATLTIHKRPIQVKINHDSKIYDGTNRFTPGFELIVSDGIFPLVNGHALRNVMAFTPEPNVGIWYSYHIEYSIYDGNEDVTANYSVDIVRSELNIEPRPITIRFGDQTKIYDGTNRFKPDFELDLNLGLDLVDGQFIQWAFVFTKDSQWGVGKNGVDYDVKIMHEVDLENRIEVTDNYLINVIYGTYTIKRRPIKVRFMEATKEYDGTNIFTPDYVLVLTDNFYDLAYGHHIVDWTVYTVDKNWGADKEVERYVLTIIDEDGRDVTENYVLDVEYGPLTITKRKLVIVIRDSEKIYDATNQFTNQNLIFDYIHSSLVPNERMDIRLEVSSRNVGNWQVVGYTIKIFAMGVDVTDNYDYTVYYDNATLSIKKRPIWIRFQPAKKIYDGHNAFNNVDYVLDLQGYYPLVNGHRLESVLKAESSIVGVWLVESLDVLQIMEGAVNVTDNYEIVHVDYPQLTIERRPIVIRFDDQEKYYDHSGTMSTGATVIILDDSYPLVDGHHLSEDIFIILKDRNWGYNKAIDNYVLDILDENDKSVLKNYDIMPIYGTYHIKRRPIKIRMLETTKIIDGTNRFLNPQYELNLDEGFQLIDGHMLELIVYASGSDIGTWLPIDYGVKIFDGQEDVTDNYLIMDPEFAPLKIVPRTIRIGFQNYTKIYDGTDWVNPGYEPLDDYGLIDGHCLELTVRISSPNAGLQTVIDYILRIYDEQGRDVTDSYEVICDDCEEGKIYVEKRPLNIITGSGKKVYDGTELTVPTYIMEGELAPGHQIHVTVTGSIAEVGKIPNYFEVEIIDQYGNIVTDNYAISSELGTLEVIPDFIDITLQPFSIRKVYDGKPIIYYPDYFWVSSGYLPEGYNIELEFEQNFNDMIAAGQYEVTIKPESVAIYDEAGNVVTHLYRITLAPAKITISPRTIEIKSLSASKFYDGKELILHEYSISKGSLIGGHTIEIIWPTEGITEVGIIENVFLDVIILDENHNDVTSNYAISKIFGILQILER